MGLERSEPCILKSKNLQYRPLLRAENSLGRRGPRATTACIAGYSEAVVPPLKSIPDQGVCAVLIIVRFAEKIPLVIGHLIILG